MRHGTYFTGRIGTVVQVLLLSLGNPALFCPVTKSRARLHFTAVLSKLHNERMATALEDFPNFQVRSVEGTRRIEFKRGVNSRETRVSPAVPFAARQKKKAPWLSRPSSCLSAM